MIKIDEELSELFGALVGDGCLSEYVSNKRKREVVLFTGNINHDIAYYETVLKPTIQKNFGIDGYIYKRHDDNTVRFFIYKKEVFCFLKQIGFPVGIKSKITIPDEINKQPQTCPH